MAIRRCTHPPELCWCWLRRGAQSSVEDKEATRQLACVNCYFMCQDGSTFKAQVKYQPYMYIGVKVSHPTHRRPKTDPWLVLARNARACVCVCVCV